MIDNMIGIVCPLAWIIASAFLLQDEARGAVISIPIQTQEKNCCKVLCIFAWHVNLFSMNKFDSNSNINSNSNCNFLGSWTECSLCWIWICRELESFLFPSNLMVSKSESEFVWIIIWICLNSDSSRFRCNCIPYISTSESVWIWIWKCLNLNLNSSESTSEFVWIQTDSDSDVIVFPT